MAEQRALIDTAPDLREQLLDANVGTIDGVLFTHDHADHTHGIDDLRILAFNMKRRIDVHFDAVTGATLRSRFDYCFAAPERQHLSADPHCARYQPATSGPHRRRRRSHRSGADRPGARVHDLAGLSHPRRRLLARHQRAVTGGSHQLSGLDLWIVDALRYVPHPSHFSVAQALEWIETLRPKRAILTHLHIDLDYEALKRELPEHVVPAYDGMTVHFD